jgi:hypothetical protein
MITPSDRMQKNHRVVPEARVTGRPRVVVVRPGGRVELPDSAAYVLITLGLAVTLLLPMALTHIR